MTLITDNFSHLCNYTIQQVLEAILHILSTTPSHLFKLSKENVFCTKYSRAYTLSNAI